MAVSYQRRSAAARAVKREAADMALFPELRRWKTVDERIEWGDELKRAVVDSAAAYDLETWERAIRRFNDMSWSLQEAAIAGFRSYNISSSAYFADLLETTSRRGA